VQGLAFVQLDIGDLDVDRIDVRQQVGGSLEHLQLEALDVDLEQYGPRQRCGQAGIETFDRSRSSPNRSIPKMAFWRSPKASRE